MGIYRETNRGYEDTKLRIRGPELVEAMDVVGHMAKHDIPFMIYYHIYKQLAGLPPAYLKYIADNTVAAYIRMHYC